MNVWYPKAKEALGKGLIDLESDDVRAQLIADPGAYDSAHDFLADLTAHKAGSGQAIAGRSMSGREWSTTADDFTVTGVAATTEIVGYVLYVHTGSDATARLLYWIDRNEWGGDWGFTANGADITVTLPSVLGRL